MVLLECADDAFPMGRVEDFRWHAERPGGSPYVDFIRDCEQRGWVTLHEVHDPASGRMIMRPRLTSSGNARIGELTAAGVLPSEAVDADDDA